MAITIIVGFFVFPLISSFHVLIRIKWYLLSLSHFWNLKYLPSLLNEFESNSSSSSILYNNVISSLRVWKNLPVKLQRPENFWNNVKLSFLYFVLKNQKSWCIPGWSETCYIAHTGLEFMAYPVRYSVCQHCVSPSTQGDLSAFASQAAAATTITTITLHDTVLLFLILLNL